MIRLKLFVLLILFFVSYIVSAQNPATQNPYVYLLSLKTKKEFNVSYQDIIRKLFETERDVEKRKDQMNLLNDVRDSYLNSSRLSVDPSMDIAEAYVIRMAKIMSKQYTLTAEQEMSLKSILIKKN